METVPWMLLGVCALALFLALVGWYRASTRIGRNNRARGRVAAVGEQGAEQLLVSQGYTIEDRQVTLRWTIEVDGEPVEVSSRVDLLVRCWGQRFVAEVKTGAHAPDPRRPATRRQLMEYLHAFDVDGVLLVDMESKAVRTVAFPTQVPP